MRRETFRFGVDAYLLAMGSGVTDGTTNQQTLVSQRNFREHAGGGGLQAVMEPAVRAGLSRQQPHIGEYSRLLLFGQRDSGTGLWPVEFRFSRAGGALGRVSVTLPDAPRSIDVSGQSLPLIVDRPFPVGTVSGGVPTVNDEMAMDALITPGQAAASQVSVVAMLVLGHLGTDHAFGNQLSGDQYK